MDFSANTSLSSHAEAIGAVRAAADQLGCAVYVTGAFARDLWLVFGGGIDAGRRTEDVDFAVECADWKTFELLSRELFGRGIERLDARVLHRFRHPNGKEIDIIPFGGVETPGRKLVWPPDGNREMDLLGFSEALAATVLVRLPGGIEVRVVSPAGLALQKLLAWIDRGALQRRKDGPDLYVLGRHYLRVRRPELPEEQQDRLLERHEFDEQFAGAELMGRDMAALSPAPVREVLRLVLERETDADGMLALVRDMAYSDPEAGLAFLTSLRTGFTDASAKPDGAAGPGS